MFLPHFTVWSARAMFERETGWCLFSAESNSLILLQGMRPQRLVVFAKERERGGGGLQRKTRLRSCGKLAARPTERPSIEGIYRLQNCFRIEQAGILGCRAMWSGSCFQTFRRNAPPHIQGYMSVNSLTFFSYKPHATHKCKRMGAREIDVCT